MMTIFLMTCHFVLALGKLVMPGGTRRLVAENVMIKQQLIVLNRNKTARGRLTSLHRLIFGFLTGLISKKRLGKVCVVLSPATVMKFHRALVKRKYRRLFSNKSQRRRKPGPKGPSTEMIKAIVDIKRKNPTYGCPKIADIVNNTFSTDIDKDVVRRVLMKHYGPDPASLVPSWLAFFGHCKDSLWSLDLFRCESVTLQTYWVLVVLDQYSRKIIGFGINGGDVDGVDIAPHVCRGNRRMWRASPHLS
jgi:transposase InsO family protein